MNVMFGIDLLPFQGSVFLICRDPGRCPGLSPVGPLDRSEALNQGVAGIRALPGPFTCRPVGPIGRRQRFALALYFFSKSPDFNPGPQFLHERTNVFKVFPLDVGHHCVF